MVDQILSRQQDPVDVVGVGWSWSHQEPGDLLYKDFKNGGMFCNAAIFLEASRRETRAYRQLKYFEL